MKTQYKYILNEEDLNENVGACDGDYEAKENEIYEKNVVSIL